MSDQSISTQLEIRGEAFGVQVPSQLVRNPMTESGSPDL